MGPVKITPSAYVSLDRDILKSALTELPSKQPLGDDTENNINYDHLAIVGGINLDYNEHNFLIRFFLPVTYHTYSLKRRTFLLKDTGSKIYFNPSLNIKYKPQLMWEFILDGSINYRPPIFDTFYKGSILTSYRNMSTYEVDLNYTKTEETSFTVRFKNVASMFFGSINATYSSSHLNTLYNTSLDGILVKNKGYKADEQTYEYGTSVRLSKGFFWKNLNFLLVSGWRKNKAPVLLENKRINTEQNIYSTNGKISLKPIQNLALSYEGIYQEIHQTQENTNMKGLYNFVHKANAAIDVTKKLLFSTQISSYYNNQSMDKNWFSLLNVSLRYKTKYIQYTLQCNNILNANQFTYSKIFGAVNFQSIYKIRPRNILLCVQFKIL